MIALLTQVHERVETTRRWMQKCSPLTLLAVRLLVAHSFLVSGWLKFGYVLNDQLDTLYFLFEDYNVPFLPVRLAAWMGMLGELVFSTLLALGLLGRLSALGLIGMSAVIYLTDHNALAPYWAMLCTIIVVHGPGTLSLDALIWRKKN